MFLTAENGRVLPAHRPHRPQSNTPPTTPRSRLRLLIGGLAIATFIVIGARSLQPRLAPQGNAPAGQPALAESAFTPEFADPHMPTRQADGETATEHEETANQQFETALPAPVSPETALPEMTQNSTGNPADSSRTVVSRELVATDLLSVNGGDTSAPVDRPVTGVALSADGRIAAFATRAGNITPHNGTWNDTQRDAIQSVAQNYEQIYVVDRTTHRLELITLGIDGLPGNGWSSAPALSPDGRFVAFYSWAGNLVPGDTNAVQDAFLYDRQTATMTRVSVSSAGQQGNDRSGDSRAEVRPALSADGRLIAFHSAATNLVEFPVSGPPATFQVYLHDRESGITHLLSAGETGTPGDGDSIHPALSADGRFVAFQSRAQNFLPESPAAPDPAPWQIWLLDRATGEMSLISQADGNPGAPETQSPEWGNADSIWPTVAGDGQRVAFQSAATNLAAPNPHRVQDIFVFDRPSREMRRVSVASMGVPGNRDSTLPVLALEGRHVAFASAAANLAGDDANNTVDIFVHDLATRHTSRVSLGVRGMWTGIEADGPALGPPALTADGRLVAFVSHATNLLADHPAPETSLPAQAYLHERRAPATHRLAGRILDTQGQPIAQAVIRAGPHRAESQADGRYHFPALVGGTYALTVEHPRYSFSPPRRVTSVLRATENVNFTGFAGIDPTRAFLDLPFAYDGSPTTFLQALRDTSEGGLVDAWFDHAYPDYTQTESVLLWDGRPRDLALYNDELGCYQRRCYDGHDGIDFPYRAQLVDQSIGPLAIPILPAAPGRVVHRVDSCHQADRWCNGGYGNEVILDHDNGYFTRYSHLDRVDVADQAAVTRATSLGLMGSTGNSHGIHLHFGVHRDNGNARWDGSAVDLPVDPFGWAGTQPDPWVVDRGGPVSHWLWLHHPTTDAALVGSMGGVVRDMAGHVQVEVPGGAFTGQARFELAPGAPEGPVPAGVRSVGRAFWLQILDWLAADQPPADEPLSLAQPLTIHVSLADLDLRHLDLEQLTLYRWTPAAQGRQPLPTVVDEERMTVTATTDRLGNFDLQAPLLCPRDSWEPDDSYFAAVPLEAETEAGTKADGETGGETDRAPMRRLFDVADDEDWFRIEIEPERTYTATVDGWAMNVLPELTLFAADGVTELAQVAAASNTESLALSWTDPDPAGAFYLRVRPLETSATGCDAVYAVRVTVAP